MQIKAGVVRLAAACLALVLIGCGGGGGNGSDAVCADFHYQEDAQSAFNSGAKQLDGDNDGIACESLPRRPSGGNGSSAGAGNITAYNLFLGQGAVALLRPAFGAYSLFYSAFSQSGGATGPLTVTSAGGASQVSSDLLTVRYALTSDGTLVTWGVSQYGGPSPGIGYVYGDAASAMDLVGTYKVLGQRCTSTGANCRSTYATVRIDASGLFEFCPEAAFSPSCTGLDRRTMTGAISAAGNAPSTWSLGYNSNYLAGSHTRHTIAFTYENFLLDINSNRVTSDHFTYFGHRDDVATSVVFDSSPMIGFDVGGVLRSEIPAASGQTVNANQPISGLFSDSSGNFYLKSATGQLVIWSAVGGLRLYSKP